MTRLNQLIERRHNQNPFTLVIDLTKGKMLQKLPSILKSTPCWQDFSISRVRQATKIDLPTSGHIVSHNQEEIRAALACHNLENIIILDDTSFSGSTNLIIENLIKSAFPDRVMNFTHGFLILNTGQLGPNPGAMQRLKSNGDEVIGGREMATPKDDGWHFFDLVNQGDLDCHLQAISELLKFIAQPNFEQLAATFLLDENMLKLIFSKTFTTEELEARRLEGHFLGNAKLNGDFHVRNPQLMPNIIRQGHLLPPTKWKGSEHEVFGLLLQLKRLLKSSEEL